MYLDIEQIEHLEELAERLEELRDKLDELSEEFMDLVTDDEFDTNELQEITNLLSKDALNAVEAANNAMSDYLFMIEDEEDSDEYNH